jgi:hypothetical protein
MTTTTRRPKRIAPWTALALWTGCLALTAATMQPLDGHYQAARAALAKGETEKAKRELKLSLQEDPLGAEAHFLLASLLGREGDLDQAMVGYRQALKLEPNNAVARYNLGTALLLRREPVPAARLLEDALSLRPDHVATYNNLAKAYFLAGIPELSVASYREALRRDPANAVAHKGLAVLALASGAPPGAGEDDEEAKPPITNAPPAAAADGKQKPPVPAEAPPRSAAERAAADAVDAQALQELLRDFPHVTVERRGDRLTLSGWTSGTNEQKRLERILAGRANVLDLTTDDVGDPHRLLEVDAIILTVLGLDSKSMGHDFLRRVTLTADVRDAASAGLTWMYSAAISYEVNIANATQQRVAFLARPHLSTLSGTPATFIAGGETVYKVAGTTSGDIKLYPFGHQPRRDSNVAADPRGGRHPARSPGGQGRTQGLPRDRQSRGPGGYGQLGLRECHRHQRGRPRSQPDPDPERAEPAGTAANQIWHSGPHVHPDHQIPLLGEQDHHFGFGHHHPSYAPGPGLLG